MLISELESHVATLVQERTSKSQLATMVSDSLILMAEIHLGELAF